MHNINWNEFSSGSDLPLGINYLGLDELEKLRFRDNILRCYLHLPQSELLEEIADDMKICVHNEQFEVAQAYLDLINDLKTLDLLY